MNSKDAKKQRRWAQIKRQRLHRDLSNHFRDRVTKLAEDSMDTGRIVNVPLAAQLNIVLTNLLQIAAMFAMRSGANREEFIKFCGGIFDGIAEQIRETESRSPTKS